MAFSQTSNVENVFARAVVVGLVKTLNNQIFYENVLDSNGTYDIVGVPFFPDFGQGSSERFLQDYFLNWGDCGSAQKVDGNIDPLPRGMVSLNSMEIDTSALTQRWIRAEFSKVIDGNIQTFNAYLNSLPLKMDFDIEIRTDTMVEAFKIVQAILDTFYKVRIFNVEFRGFMIPCQISFPENYPIERAMEFSYPSENKINFTFSLEIETYYPVIDEPNMGSVEGRKLLADGDGDITKKRLTNADFDMVLRRRVGSYAAMVSNPIEQEMVPNPDWDGEDWDKEFIPDPNWQEMIPNPVLEGAGLGMSDNLSSKTSSIRQARNTMDGIIIEKENDQAGFNWYQHRPVLNLETPKVGVTLLSKDTIEISWKFTGWLDKVNGYWSDDYGTTWNTFMRLYDAHKGSFMWQLPEFNPTIEAVVISDVKVLEKAIIRLISDVNGTITDYIIINPGLGYDEATSIEIEAEGTGALIEPLVVNRRIEGITILNGGSGYKPSKETEIAIKIRSSADETIFDTTKDEQGNLGVISVK